VSVLCISLLLPAAALAAPRYAAPLGSGTACSATAPCDLPTAVNMASAGDDVIVHAGSYDLATGLTPAVDLTVHGSPGASRPVIAGASGVIPFENDNGSLALQDLTVESTGADGLRLFGNGSSAERVQVSSSGGSVAIRTGADTVLRDILAVSTGGGAAVFLQGASAVNDVALRNVTAIASGTGSNAVSVFGTLAANSAVIHATNVIADAQTDLTVAGQNASIDVDHSNFDTVSGPVSFGTGNQSAPSQFVNAAAGDYHEGTSSPTVGAGLTDPLNGTLDLDGLDRTAGQGTDIGAYQLQLPAAVPPAAPPDTTAPHTTIGRLRLSRRGVLAFTLTCPTAEIRCQWAYSLRSRHRVRAAKRPKPRVLNLGSGHASAAGGKLVTVHLRLSTRSLRLIRRHHGLPVTLVVRTTDAAGNEATGRRGGKLRIPRATKRTA
jgi:hypothetical protein